MFTKIKVEDLTTEEFDRYKQKIGYDYKQNPVGTSADNYLNRISLRRELDARGVKYEETDQGFNVNIEGVDLVLYHNAKKVKIVGQKEVFTVSDLDVIFVRLQEEINKINSAKAVASAASYVVSSENKNKSVMMTAQELVSFRDKGRGSLFGRANRLVIKDFINTMIGVLNSLNGTKVQKSKFIRHPAGKNSGGIAERELFYMLCKRIGIINDSDVITFNSAKSSSVLHDLSPMLEEAIKLDKANKKNNKKQ